MSSSRQHELSNMSHEFFTQTKNAYPHHSQSSGNSTSWHKEEVGNEMTSALLSAHLPPLPCLLSQMNCLLQPPQHLCQLKMLTLRQRCPFSPWHHISTTTHPYASTPTTYLAYAPTVPYRYTSAPATPTLPSPFLTLPQCSIDMFIPSSPILMLVDPCLVCSVAYNAEAPAVPSNSLT
ncbi:hypothetical protein O181_002088 [Austropuccinia psidii MF-1]|uniref:Uncharacterized protein n=1 Tax=Austropuccinia psidii MF-1 TaxID=1389203 RepID=A0A9Q3BC27_9BASI|nr:hypothetical protein [Austropuccinia psidii MF-1]